MLSIHQQICSQRAATYTTHKDCDAMRDGNVTNKFFHVHRGSHVVPPQRRRSRHAALTSLFWQKQLRQCPGRNHDSARAQAKSLVRARYKSWHREIRAASDATPATSTAPCWPVCGLCVYPLG
jgi:hypothetical protein